MDGYDVIASGVKNIPKSAGIVLGYDDGLYAWTPAQFASFPNSIIGHITTKPVPNPNSTICDCERFDATPAAAAEWAHKRIQMGFVPCIYCDKSTWSEVIPLVTTIPVDWWIADYLPGQPAHILPGTVGTQYGSFPQYDRSIFLDGYTPGRSLDSLKGSHMSVPNAPCIGLYPTKSNNGYWLVGADGGVFTYGDAQFFGSLGSTPLAKPIVDFIPTPSQQGYYLVGADYGVFTFGDAKYLGHPS